MQKKIQSNYFNQSKNMGIEEILIEHYKQEGKQEGMEKGIEKGIEKGRIETILQKDRIFATNLILSTEFDDTKIANLVGVSIDFIKALRQEMTKS